MHTLDATELAQCLMREHQLQDWSFGFNRAKRQLGICLYGERRIELSVHFVRANDEAAVRDTILHEIAHALAGPRAGHGRTWKAVCARIGAQPQRTDRHAQMPRGLWQATCGHCGQVHHRHRRPARGRTYICRSCGPLDGKLQFVHALRRVPS